jgi:hypothetical protein
MRLFFIIVILMAAVSCSTTRQGPFLRTKARTQFYFHSDTVNGVTYLKKDPAMKVARKKMVYAGNEYYTMKIFGLDGKRYQEYWRVVGAKVFSVNSEVIRRGLREQLLFDFAANKGDCWRWTDVLDNIDITYDRSYVANGDSVHVFSFWFIDNVSHIPMLEEMHVSPEVGVLQVKFSDGKYTRCRGHLGE